MKRGLALSAVVVLLLCFAGAAFAGVTIKSKYGTTESVVFPIGARAIGMGGAFIAVSDDATAPFWNPAGLSRVSQFQTTLEVGADVSDFDVDQDDVETLADALSGDLDTPSGYQDLDRILRDLGLQGTEQQVRVGTGVSFAMRGLALSAVGDAGGYITLAGGSGNPITIDGTAVGLFGPAISAARMIKGNMALGLTLRALRAKGYLANYSLDSQGVSSGDGAETDDDRNIAVDVGLLTRTKDGLDVGVVLRNANSPNFNLNPSAALGAMSAKLDWSLDVGVAAREGDLLLAWDIADIGRNGALQVNMGLEYKPLRQYIALRAGMMGGDYTLGAGLQLGMLALDVASGERVKSMAALNLRTAW